MTWLLRTDALLLCVLGSAAALHACGSGGGDGTGPPAAEDSGAVDSVVAEDTARPDTNIGTAATCVQSKAPAPFATTGCLSPQPKAPDSFDQALGLAGIDRCKLVLDRKQVSSPLYKLADPRVAQLLELGREIVSTRLSAQHAVLEELAAERVAEP